MANESEKAPWIVIGLTYWKYWSKYLKTNKWYNNSKVRYVYHSNYAGIQIASAMVLPQSPLLPPPPRVMCGMMMSGSYHCLTTYRCDLPFSWKRLTGFVRVQGDPWGMGVSKQWYDPCSSPMFCNDDDTDINHASPSFNDTQPRTPAVNNLFQLFFPFFGASAGPPAQIPL